MNAMQAGGAALDRYSSEEQTRRIRLSYASGHRRVPAWTNADHAETIRAYLGGESAKSIGARLGRSHNAIMHRIRGADVVRSLDASLVANAARANQQRRPLTERFARHYIPEPNSGCFLWIGSIDSRGYGQLRDAGRIRVATHVSLEIAGRPVPTGLCALHRCDLPACVNPDHLFVGTTKQNVRDMMDKGRNSLPPVRRGEANATAKLTEQQIRDIRQDLASGFSLRDVGRKFNIGYTHVSAIKRGKVWSHVV